MEPRVQYVQTADGVNIAYYEMGQGVPYVYMNMPFSHLTAEWEMFSPLYTMIASTLRLVRYDARGFGLSTRDPSDMSLDAFVLDLEAVVDRLGLSTFIMNAAIYATPVALAYAVRHPERVSRLVLVGAAAGPRREIIEQTNGLIEVARGDWRFFSEAITRLAFTSGWEDAENSASFSRLLRESSTFDGLRKFLDSSAAWDVTELLPNVQAPTLVVSTKNHPWHGVEVSREVAARLPNGQLAMVDDSSQARFMLESTLAVRSFLGAADDVPEAAPDEATVTSTGTAIILFTDIADSTALTERLGDAGFRSASRALDERIRTAMREASGTPIDGKVLGDGVMGAFASAAQAIDAARRCVAASSEVELPLHIGIHAGDVIHEEGNVYGGAVNIAARICALCEPGEDLRLGDGARPRADIGGGYLRGPRGA